MREGCRARLMMGFLHHSADLPIRRLDGNRRTRDLANILWRRTADGVPDLLHLPTSQSTSFSWDPPKNNTVVLSCLAMFLYTKIQYRKPARCKIQQYHHLSCRLRFTQRQTITTLDCKDQLFNVSMLLQRNLMICVFTFHLDSFPLKLPIT